VRDLLRFCEAEREWLLELVEALVELESPSDDKAAVDACGRELERRLRALGARVERLPRAEAGDLVAAEIGDGPRRVLLLGHLDTVWPVGQLAVMPYRREQGRIYGPGVYDMKAGVALGLLAVRALVETGRAGALRVAMLWTSDEEIGSRASRGAIEEAARRSRAVLVLEPALPGGALKTQRKACGEFEVVVHGRAAHAGLEPEKGASAIHELAEQILALERLNDVARGVTVNVGVGSFCRISSTPSIPRAPGRSIPAGSEAITLATGTE
jgi:glutamate carboxypeptidase